MTSPKVTILLTSYNHADYLADAIESALAQSYDDYELLIVDDCSDDNSYEVAKSYQSKNITVVRNPVRLRAHGVNEAIRNHAHGEYIAMHHSDDLFKPHKLETQIPVMEQNPELGAIFSHADLIDEDNNEHNSDPGNYQLINHGNRSRNQWLNLFFYHGNRLWHPSAVVRKQCYYDVGFYDRRFGQMTDYDMWVRLCLRYPIQIIEEPLISFRVHKGQKNTSAFALDKQIRGKNEIQQVLKRFLAISTLEELLETFPEAKAIACGNNDNIKYLLAMTALKHGNHRHRVFGLNQLYDLMQDETIAAEINNKYNFNYPELIELSGEQDLYHFSKLSCFDESKAN